jgi:hypothetical protein
MQNVINYINKTNQNILYRLTLRCIERGEYGLHQTDRTEMKLRRQKIPNTYSIQNRYMVSENQQSDGVRNLGGGGGPGPPPAPRRRRR